MDTYNKENNFAVIMRNGRNTNWYSQDCCALISHIEKEKKEAEISNNPLGDLSDDGAHNEYYLKIKLYYIDNNIETNSGTNYLYNGEIYNPNKEHLFSSTNFYRISPCGKIYSDVIF
ncbi:hypothetical protein [Cardiobacterium valvarum]|uniref:hypothetical protein n=1 Tax=Cardiobacterium valvarum TaxID=194702 RepID=UPI0011C6FC84|nr:hypothetical protein [Cardiobacterium valvarum]